MIVGLGSDICDIRRIEASLARFGERFTLRIFSEVERARSDRRPHSRAASYAKRFAAKEACAKALGTGFRRGVFFADLRVTNLASGQPTMSLHGGALARLAALIPPGHAPHVALSLTDEYPYAYAQVIISAVPLTAAGD
ncbi:MAG TPA: holo-ACP synthase [Acidocella sp.]|jgi:holo-[acyl-carrier protein] synthase|uniref:holo-ACP synthase n=1 Tax=Acidocella sp. TaxID=50710 RepID=UPI002CC3BF2C|nr:holo-ACP synthase [Acidocella sp.]HVE23659.1 holo-ACP synthase [Acidocella sp.]